MIAAEPLLTGGFITAALAGIAGVVTAFRAWRETSGKADETWVGLVERASQMLEERVAYVEQQEAKCQRNVEKLRSALTDAGIPVPPLE